jgi:hypothetical protein
VLGIVVVGGKEMDSCIQVYRNHLVRRVWRPVVDPDGGRWFFSEAVHGVGCITVDLVPC